MSLKHLYSCLCCWPLRATGLHSFADSPSAFTIAAVSGSPAGANSSEPQLTVQGDRVILSWLEVAGERATLKFAERTPSGWSASAARNAGQKLFCECV